MCASRPKGQIQRLHFPSPQNESQGEEMENGRDKHDLTASSAEERGVMRE